LRGKKETQKRGLRPGPRQSFNMPDEIVDRELSLGGSLHYRKREERGHYIHDGPGLGKADSGIASDMKGGGSWRRTDPQNEKRG